MCLAMNADRLEPGERCASTSNRNFEGRQGRGGRTHLVSPAMAAAAAIAGHLADVRGLPPAPRRPTDPARDGVAGAFVFRRIAAFAVDMLAVGLATVMLLLSLSMIAAVGGWPGLISQPACVAVLAAVFAVYFASSERQAGGATLGKAFFRLTVQRVDGQPLGWLRALARQGFKLALGLGCRWPGPCPTTAPA